MILKLRNVFPLEYAKAIRVKFEFPYRVFGHLKFLRKNHLNYNYINGDGIDTSLLNIMRNYGVSSELIYNYPLYADQEYDNFSQITKGGVEKDIVFTFYTIPVFSNEDLSKTNATNVESISKSLKMTFWTNDILHIKNVPNEIMIRLLKEDFENIDTLVCI